MGKLMRTLWLYLRRQADLEINRRKLWLPVWFAVGIGLYFCLPAEPSKWITLALIEALIATAIIFRFQPKILRCLLYAALLLGGFAWIQARTLYLASQMGEIPSSKLYLQGQIIKVDTNQRGKIRLTLDSLRDFDNKLIKGRFRITLRQKQGDYSTGQCVELVARLMPRAMAPMPGGYEFDRKNFYNRLSGSGYAESSALLTDCPPQTKVSSVSVAASGWRQRIVKHIYSVLPAEEAAIAAAIIAGEQSGINQGQIKNYRNSGLAHFLSISGLHMSMLAGLMFFFVRLLLVLFPSLALRLDSKKIAAVAAIAISAVYLCISGAAIPAQRAFVMALIVLLGVLFNRRAISMQSIAWAAVLVLIISPEALVGAGFQMSFAAVIALIAFYEQFAARLRRWFCADKSSLPSLMIKGALAYAVGIIVADLVASLATLPFAVYHFNRVALYTSLTNFLAGPIIGFLIMPFALLALLLMPFGLDWPALRLVGLGIDWLNHITAWVSSLDGASLLILSPPLWGILLVVFGGLWLCIWERRWRLWGVPLIIIGMASSLFISKPDMLVNEDASMLALQDNYGNMVILPAHGNGFTKQIWLDKTASVPLDSARRRQLLQIRKGKTIAPQWLDLQCNRQFCLYKKRVKIFTDGAIEIDNFPLNLQHTGGVAIYLDTPAQIISVRQSVGRRPWNL